MRATSRRLEMDGQGAHLTAAMDAAARLSALLDSERERVVRLWSKRLSVELHEDVVSATELKETLARHVEQLARLLRDRPEDATRLWPEYARPHGAGRFIRGFDAD